MLIPAILLALVAVRAEPASASDAADAIAERFAREPEREAKARKAAAEKAAADARAADEARRKAEAGRRAAEEAEMLARARAEAEERRAEIERRQAAQELAEKERIEKERAEKEKAARELAEREAAEAARKAAEAKAREEESRKAAELQRQAREAEARRLAEEKAAAEARKTAEAERARREADARRAVEEKAAAELARIEKERAERAAAEAERVRKEEEARRIAQAKAAEEARQKAEAEQLARQASAREAEKRELAERMKRAQDSRGNDGAHPSLDAAPVVGPVRPIQRPDDQMAALDQWRRPAEDDPALKYRVSVLIVMQPGRKGIRRFDKTADPMLCVAESCYLSEGADRDARQLRRSEAFGPGVALGGRAEACNGRLACVFRNIDLEAERALLQPIDLRILRHDRREVREVAPDHTCRHERGYLKCDRTVRANDYRLWVVPESLARRVGATVLEAALTAGFAD